MVLSRKCLLYSVVISWLYCKVYVGDGVDIEIDAAAYSDRPGLYGVTCALAHVTCTIQGQIIPTTTISIFPTRRSTTLISTQYDPGMK